MVVDDYPRFLCIHTTVHCSCDPNLELLNLLYPAAIAVNLVTIVSIRMLCLRRGSSRRRQLDERTEGSLTYSISLCVHQDIDHWGFDHILVMASLRGSQPDASSCANSEHFRST